jgi:hypothetical protein
MAIVFCKWERVSLGQLLSGTEPVHVILDQWDLDFGHPDHALLERAASVQVVSDFNSLEEIVAVATHLRLDGVRVDRIASFAEFSQYGAGLLAQLLDVSDPSLKLIVATRDKREMKDTLRRAGIPCAKFVSIPDAARPPAASMISETLGFPVVVKPVSGMGVMSTVRIDRSEEFQPALAALEFPPVIHSHQLMAEEFIDGEEFHADAVWHEGEPWHFTVSGYPRPRLSMKAGEEETILLNPSRYASFIAEVLRFQQEVNKALGIVSGGTHFEFFRRPEGTLVASEIASRFGGGSVLDTVLARDGVDLRELWALELLGREYQPAPATAGQDRWVAGINIPPRGTGRITAVPSAAELDADPQIVMHHINCAAGEEIATPWPLILVLCADSEAGITQTIERVRDRYVIETAG